MLSCISKAVKQVDQSGYGSSEGKCIHTHSNVITFFVPSSHNVNSVVDSFYYFSREKTGEDKCSLCLRSAVFCPQVQDLVSTSLS